VPQVPSKFVYLRNDSTGRHVGAEPDGTVKMHEHCGDDCMWLLEESGGSYQLRSATTELVLEGQSAEPVVAPYGEKGVAMTLGGIRDLFPSKPEESEAENPMMAAMGISASRVQDPDDELGEGECVFTALCGTNRLPSEYVKEMDETGYAILDNIYRPEDIRDIKQMHAEMVGDGSNMPEEGRAGLDGNQVLCNCPVLSKGSFHPISMWVIQRYLGVPERKCSLPLRLLLKKLKAAGAHSSHEPRALLHHHQAGNDPGGEAGQRRLCAPRPPLSAFVSVSASCAARSPPVLFAQGTRTTPTAPAVSSTMSIRSRRASASSTTSAWTSSHRRM